jgi:hypothetical protein
MVLRALTSLRAELVKSNENSETIASKSAIVQGVKKTVAAAPDAPAAPEDMPPSRKSKPKKSEPFNAWPQSEDEDEVETINIGKKS